MAITKEQVFAIADRMFSEGETPTLITIRKELGSGSFSTLSAMLAEWKAATRTEPSQLAPFPELMQEHLNTFGRAIWAAALEVARPLITQAREESSQLIEKSRLSEAEALQVASCVQEEADAAIKQCQLLSSYNDELKKAHDLLSIELALAKGSNEHLQKTNADLLKALGGKKSHVQDPAVKPIKAAKIPKTDTTGKLDL